MDNRLDKSELFALGSLAFALFAVGDFLYSCAVPFWQKWPFMDWIWIVFAGISISLYQIGKRLEKKS